MTAGSYCYIGPQGIVHGTTVKGEKRGLFLELLFASLAPFFIPPFLQLTVLNAGRKYLGVESLAGKVFLTSGLGGMSGAQAKVHSDWD